MANTEQYKQILTNRARELEEAIIRQRSNGVEARSAEVEDPIDAVTTAEGQETAFEETSRLSDTLQEVRMALQRIEDGTFGRCIACGREIEEARLAAVPWTPYCKDDQEKRDRRSAATAAEDIS